MTLNPRLRWLALPLLLGLAVTAGCLKEAKYSMRYNTEGMAEAHIPKWPQPPEKPHYRFAGELTGVDNFELITESVSTHAERAFNLLVGLDPMSKLRRSDKGELNRPQTGMVDTLGRIMVTDLSRQGVMVFNEDQGKLAVWTRAQEMLPFASPVGIVEGDNGDILVADSEHHMVVRLDTDGQPQGDFGRKELKRPTGLARDSKRKEIYVADTGSHDIKVFSDAGELLRIIGKRGNEPGYFNAPTHLAFEGDKLYVSDTLNARVQVFDPAGKILLNFGSRGLYVGQMVRPKGITVDRDGNIYVVESFHDHMLVFDKNGEFLLPIGGTGREIGEFYLPSGLWSDINDRIFVSDMFNGRIIIFQYLGV